MKSIYKILLITDNHNENSGGAEKYFFTLKSALAQQPELDVVSLGFGAEAKIDNSTVILKESAVPLLRYWWRLFFNPLKYIQIRRAIKHINPDIIHLHNVKKYTISLLKAVQPYAVVQTLHDYACICPTGWNVHNNLQPCATGLNADCVWQHRRNINPLVYLGRLYGFWRMKKLLKKMVKKSIAPSPQLTDYLQRNHFRDVTYLPPFVETAKSVELDKMQPGHFLYVGQLSPHKGVVHLLDEFALACQSKPELILKIAGTGADADELKAKVRKLKLEQNIIFLGWCNPEKYYEEAMAVIFPSIGLEAFGLVITEAMRHGRPVIGTERGPTAWLVEHGKTGLLYDPLVAGQLAEKILLLAGNGELAVEYGLNAAEKFKNMMGNEEIIKRQIGIYREVLSGVPL
jgi:glycosyltransferase involved in cell wall biosynthesis